MVVFTDPNAPSASEGVSAVRPERRSEMWCEWTSGLAERLKHSRRSTPSGEDDRERSVACGSDTRGRSERQVSRTGPCFDRRNKFFVLRNAKTELRPLPW